MIFYPKDDFVAQGNTVFGSMFLLFVIWLILHIYVVCIQKDVNINEKVPEPYEKVMELQKEGDTNQYKTTQMETLKNQISDNHNVLIPENLNNQEKKHLLETPIAEPEGDNVDWEIVSLTFKDNYYLYIG